MDENAILIEHLCKSYKLYEKQSHRLLDSLGLKKEPYREHFALNDVSMSVKRGETVGIIGTNGAGKSTILKIITGVLSPTSGNIVVNGRISALLELGAGFNQQYTGIENVYLNGTMSGLSKQEIDDRLESILEFADIGDYVRQPVKTYSSGMFVRLAFAMAINVEPEILIIDEALSVGDVFFQSKCYRKFEEFRDQGKTILFVSHDLSSINRYCDRAVLLDHGTLRAEGSPKEMIDLYKRVLVGADSQKNVPKKRSSITEQVDGKWKAKLNLNPNCNEYGDRKAVIVDFALIDEAGLITSTILKGTSFIIKSKVEFHEDIHEPIFTFTFKDKKGVDITGTNTMIEKCVIGDVHKGETYVAEFEQVMNLQGGEYLLSVSCTGYDGVEFVVHHRLYDVVNVTVVSDKNTVGFYDMDSKVSVEKVE